MRRLLLEVQDLRLVDPERAPGDQPAEQVATDAKTLTLTTETPTAISFLLFCLSANVAAIVEKKMETMTGAMDV